MGTQQQAFVEKLAKAVDEKGQYKVSHSQNTADLSKISNYGEARKRFDFVFVDSNNLVYGAECNFYSSQGSKLNETARSYKTLALESKNIKNFRFIWLTDGIGWKSAKNNLKETFDVLNDIYNITDLEKGIINKLVNFDEKIINLVDTI